MSATRRIADLMRRAAASGHYRWRIAQLRKRTGMGYQTTYNALKELEAEGRVRLETPEWIWIARKRTK